MKKDNGFIRLCLLQIIAIILFLISYLNTAAEKEMFQGVSEFIPVKAICVSSKKNSSYTYRYRWNYYEGYNNKYNYEVNGQNYVVTYYNEPFDKSGKEMMLYYHPERPDICSKYQTYSSARAHYSLYTLVGMIIQGIIIFFAFRAMSRDKEQRIINENHGVVLRDDFDFILNQKGNTQKDEQPHANSTGQVDDVSDKVKTISFVRENKAMNNDFALYTEEEYNAMKKKENENGKYSN